MIKHKQIARRLNNVDGSFSKDPFFVVPCPQSLHWPMKGGALLDGSASIDLRLGTWFLSLHQARTPVIEARQPSEVIRRLRLAAEEAGLTITTYKKLTKHLISSTREEQMVRSYHVRFGQDFILHPRSFALGVTLEWMRIPSDLGGYVTGRSFWGRRGLVIATATGVHPGFTGCLTLELANLGDVPISIQPGMTIGQLFLHAIQMEEDDRTVDQSSFACKRRPLLGKAQADPVAEKLANASDQGPIAFGRGVRRGKRK